MRAYARLPGLARARPVGARERERSKYTRPQEPWGRHCYTILLHGGELTVWHGDGRSKRERVPGPTPPTALQLRTVRARLGARTAGRSNVYVTSTSLSPRFYRAWLRDAVWGKKPLPAPRPRPLARSLPSTRRRPCASPIDARTLYACMWLLVYLAGSFDIDSAAQRIQ